MCFSIIRSLPVGAFFLLVSAPVQAQLAAEAPRFPRIAGIADLAFEPSGSLAGHAAAMGLPESPHLEYQVLDANGKAALASAGAKPDSPLTQRRMGTGQMQVMVPAGTFNCYPVESNCELTTVSRPGLNAKSSGKRVDYYDPAVGLIKTNYYDNNGKLLQSRVLSKR